MGGSGIVGDAVDPGAEGATAVEGLKAAPEGDVNLLEQIEAGFGVGLPGAGEALEGGAVEVERFFKLAIAVGLSMFG
jgi:hypothetical protein